jgi:hypothetical protein
MNDNPYRAGGGESRKPHSNSEPTDAIPSLSSYIPKSQFGWRQAAIVVGSITVIYLLYRFVQFIVWAQAV